MGKSLTKFEESPDYKILDEFEITKDGKKRRLAECNYCHKKHNAFGIMAHVHTHRGLSN